MLYVLPVDGRLLLPGLFGGRRREVLCPAQRNLLSHLCFVPVMLGKGTILEIVQVSRGEQGTAVLKPEQFKATSPAAKTSRMATRTSSRNFC